VEEEGEGAKGEADLPKENPGPFHHKTVAVWEKGEKDVEENCEESDCFRE